MALSFGDAKTQLLSGKPLPWTKYKDLLSGSIVLAKPEQRRLLEFLLSKDPTDVANGSENLFDGILKAWKNDGYDPAANAAIQVPQANPQSWRLERIETSGFGGLNSHGGKNFDLYIGGGNWCLEGQNGSGKTSLVSAILWTLTGKRIREHDGPVDERADREAVVDDQGKTIGSWPPIAAYPATPAGLSNSVEVWARLTFKAENGDIATVYRHLSSPAVGIAQHKHQFDPRLAKAAQLIEIGVLMPARVSKIGFGKGSQSLFEAVKKITGLDQFAAIAEGCSALGAGNRKFIRYAKDQGIDNYVRRFNDQLGTAKKIADEYQFSLPQALELQMQGVAEALKTRSKAASDAAGEHLKTLQSEIGSAVDTTTSAGRTGIRNAVTSARGTLDQAQKSIPLFSSWKALTAAAIDTEFAKFVSAIDQADVALTTAMQWHERQTHDGKLRLKALAAQSFAPSANAEANCPLCTSPLDDAEKKALAEELKNLKVNASAAEQRIADACRGILDDLNQRIPIALQNKRESIDSMDPAQAYSAAMTETFVDGEPYSTILVGIAAVAKAAIAVQTAGLPHFDFAAFAPTKSEPEAATKLRREIHLMRRLYALVSWWKTHRSAFGDTWASLVGKKVENGLPPAGSIERKLALLEQALEHARPLDDFSRSLKGAADAAESWQQIEAVQRTRKAIVESLVPLKELKVLVSAETSRSIAGLSERIDSLCERICLKERLVYKEATVGRKEVGIVGSFSPGMRIDAALVANTSWLRAILWSFVFALREETLQAVGANVFPLVVLDDPQTTFDPRNKRKWAQELVRCANMTGSELNQSQLIVTTHERIFYQMLVSHEKLKAQQGLIGGVNAISGVATIASGGELERLYEEARVSNNDAKAKEYIRKVRIYCEDLIKFMLRSFGNQIPDMTLNKLREELKDLAEKHVAPFDRKAFEKLVAALKESEKAIQYINEPHHKEDETYGLAEAGVVKAYWDGILLDKLHAAFSAFDAFELYTGEPRTFPWAKNVVNFPDGHLIRVKAAEMHQTGLAAAAKTGGRAGDGILTVQQWEGGDKVVLPNHGVFQLAAGTLDPVAGVGDLIIVSNYAKPTPRSLVIAICGASLLARRLNTPENHSEIVVLTGQSVDPLSLPAPVIVQPDNKFRKIVGTLFTAHLLPAPPMSAGMEFAPLSDAAIVDKTLKGARLFKVDGRSAEPIALQGQYLITRNTPTSAAGLAALNGRLVVAVDENGARYFKRLQCRQNFVVLESLNPDGFTAAEILSFDGSQGLPKITEALEVVGVLFELPG
jgi:hypothetical protein